MSDIRAIICVGMTENRDIDARLLACLVRDYGTIATQWADPIIHPDDGRIAEYITDRVISYLSPSELERVVYLPDDWIPPQPPNES